jgi:phage FluMu gp28-like protein
MGSSEAESVRQQGTEAIPLYAYQRRWVQDRARFKMGLWSRQSGKSFGTSLEAVLDCWERRTKWVFLSAGERQSKELMATAQMHARAVNLAIDTVQEEFRADDDTVYKQLEIVFPNKSRIVGLPANPSTARGHSAHILLDEFAFHKDSRGIWRALFPTVTRGFGIRIVTTPQGRQNKAYEIWSGNPRYSKHKLTIFDAVAGGLDLKDEEGNPCTPEDLREALGDDEGWQQEYLCEFLDEATAWLTYEMIGEAEVATLGMDVAPEGGAIYAGVDVGRKRDLTVFWALEMVGDVLWSRKILELEKTKFSEQERQIWAEIERLKPRRTCFDATGLGMQFAERAQEKFGSSRVEAVTLTAPVKEDLATTIKGRFEDKRVRIPVDRKIREDLHRVKKLVTSAGNVRFDAERSDDGHSDRFWALALAIHAGTGVGKAAYGGTEPESTLRIADFMLRNCGEGAAPTEEEEEDRRGFFGTRGGLPSMRRSA